MRLIDADELIKCLDNCVWNDVTEVVREQPTIVTHCKDCKHWSNAVAIATEHAKLCEIGGYMVGANGYCVYANKEKE